MDKTIIDKISRQVKLKQTNLSTWYERLKFFRENVLKLTQPKFARELEIDSTSLSRYERGKGSKDLSFKLRVRLEELYGYDVVKWIATGELPNDDSNKQEVVVKETNTCNENQLPVEVLSVRPSAGASSHLEAIDIFDSGQRLFIDRAFLKRSPVGKLRAMQIDGYSMVPMLFPDSWVILDETKEFVGDGLYVLNFDNILMVKLLEINPQTGRLWVKSANPDYDSWEIKDEDQRAFEIFGKVVRCII